MPENERTPVGPPAPSVPRSPDPGVGTSTATGRRRTLVLPAVLAALALGAAGTGVGYAAARRALPSASADTSTQGSPSARVLAPPGYAQDPWGDQQPYGYVDPRTGGTDGTTGNSTDTTSQASGSQLTGLVRIVSTMTYDGAKAAGTGMVLTSDGEVVTNHHVVEGATSIKVKVMSTGTTYSARVVGTDATDDVAVLQLQDASGLDTVTPDADGVSQGDPVTAVGDGNGTMSYLSAATGSVIATDQPVTTQGDNVSAGESLSGMIEISSDVVGGYSGGATYDADGQVVGMTTAATSGTSDIVGYAIPISTVLGIAGDLEAGTAMTDYAYGYPAFLGVGLGDGTTVQGVYDGTPAADAGLEAGNTITSVDGTPVSTADGLHSAIASLSPGDRVSIAWTDGNGTGHTATVTLGRGPVA